MSWPVISVAERSWTMSWRALGLNEEKLAEAGAGAGKVKSESVDEASELSEVSKVSSLTIGIEVEVEVDEERKIIFSCENCSDMQYNSLRHTRSDQVLVKQHAAFPQPQEFMFENFLNNLHWILYTFHIQK